MHAGWSAEADPERPLREMHERHVLQFIGSNGFGVERLMAMAEDEEGLHYGKPVAGTQWLISELVLIGVAMHDPPRAFGGKFGTWVRHQPDEGGSWIADPAAADGRALTTAEREALGALQSGRELVSLPEGRGLRVTGAIRAGSECLGCHRDKRAGDLLGAFAYRLRPQRFELPPPSPAQRQVR